MLKCPKIRQDKILSNFENLRCQNSVNLKGERFSAKVEKVVRIVLYGPAVSQSGCRKAGPYQLPLNNSKYGTNTKSINNLLYDPC